MCERPRELPPHIVLALPARVGGERRGIGHLLVRPGVSGDRPASQPSRAASWKIGSSEARACAGVAPGASRPMMRIHQYQGCARAARSG